MFEQIVRPFQTTTTIVDRQITVTKPNKVALQKAILVWGAVGQAPTMSGLSFTVKDPDNKFKETSRKTTDHRIQNPNDPNQYVVAQSIDSIAFQKLPASTSAASTPAYAPSPPLTPTTNNPLTTTATASTQNSSDSYTLQP